MSSATFPDTLFSSSDFGGDDLVLSPASFMTERDNCRESDFGPDFDPEYTEWDKVAGSEDLYSTVDVRTQDGKTQMTTLTAQATWSEANGSFKLREIDADLEDDQEVYEDLGAYTNSLLLFTPSVHDEPEESEATLAQKNLSIVESFLHDGEMAERFNELEYVDVDRTSDDLTGITFMDGSGLLIDLQLNTVEIVDA